MGKGGYFKYNLFDKLKLNIVLLPVSFFCLHILNAWVLWKHSWVKTNCTFRDRAFWSLRKKTFLWKWHITSISRSECAFFNVCSKPYMRGINSAGHVIVAIWWANNLITYHAFKSSALLTRIMNLIHVKRYNTGF